MANAPVTTNIWATFIDGLIDKLTQFGEVEAQAFIAASPYFFWMEWPGFSIITNAAISAAGNRIDTYSAKMVSAAVIDVQTNLEKSDIGNAVIQQRQATASGDQNAITAANTSFDNAFGNLKTTTKKESK